LDFGLAYTKASDVQNAADAASLAAAQMLPVDESDEAKIAEIKNTAVLYAEKNNMTDLSSGDVELGNLIDGKFTSVMIR